MNVSACPPRRPDEAATRLTLRLDREKVTGTCFPSAPVPFLPPVAIFLTQIGLLTVAPIFWTSGPEMKTERSMFGFGASQYSVGDFV